MTVLYDPRKPLPWPIKLVKKLGVKDDTSATYVILVVCVLLLIVTVFLYRDLLSEPEIEEIDPAILMEMEAQAQQKL